ncbi:MAG TPA: FAD-dependent oxidoreductase [Solirubrobacteraceae bacterium]|nr:FAD-dependent oxidoreductase [Solirubrobacteraceae bacterium]
MPSTSGDPRVVIAGGGVAGSEALLALAALARKRLDVTLVSAQPDFHYRFLDIDEPFGLGRARRYALDALAQAAGARFVCDTVGRVDVAGRRVLLGGGDELPYDALLLATGAATVPAFEYGVSFDLLLEQDAFDEVLADNRAGFAPSVAIIVPAGVSWTLPAYELALRMAQWMRETGEPALTLLTPEPEPLGVFGPQAAAEVARVLTDAGIAVRGGTVAEPVSNTTYRVAPSGEWAEVDRIVALPQLAGVPIPGVPCDDGGWVPVDEHGRVPGCEGLYAAGDGTSFWMKQGGIAAQQADVAAQHIAVTLGGSEREPEPFRPVLRGMLRTRDGARYMRIDLADGHPPEVSDAPLWWPPGKIASRWLAAHLSDAERDAEDRERYLRRVADARRRR